MAEFEIDKEDVHDRKKWRRNVNEEGVQPYRKTDYNPIVIWFHCGSFNAIINSKIVE